MKNFYSVALTVCLAMLGGQALQAQVTGSGTTDYVPLWTSSSSLGNSLLFQKGGFIGISNSSPAYTLDVGGYINAGLGYRYAGSVILATPGGFSNGDLAIGYQALMSNTGSFNTATGYWALLHNTTANYNTATGYAPLAANTIGEFNTAHGYLALNANTIGNTNSAFGANSLTLNTTSSGNTAVGYQALRATTAGFNTGVGAGAIDANTTGEFNTAVGNSALQNITTGSNDVAIGYSAGSNVTGANSNNIHISNTGLSADNATIRIGTQGTQAAFYAAGIYGTTTALSGAVEVMIDSAGQLGTKSSSIRFKEDVHDMADSSSGLLRLRPVTYRYKQAYADGSKPIDYGLIAEEVAEIYPDLVARNADGQIQTVQYQKLTPMLLNELQKQSETIRLLEKRLAALESTVHIAR
jgi:Chaperone of endosialidase